MWCSYLCVEEGWSGWCVVLCFFQAEDGIRDLVRSRGLGDVYKRQTQQRHHGLGEPEHHRDVDEGRQAEGEREPLSLIHI